MQSDVPPVRDVLLLGGGHTHVQVLRSLAMKPLSGARITIVSRESFTPYSGMLPGHVAGFYGWHDIHIDLGPLARAAGARLIPHEAVGIDAAAQYLTLAGHPPVRYDILSINSGAAPAQAGAVGIPVKPIGRFLPRWHEVRSSARPGQRITLVGGGAGGVELALAIRRAVDRRIDVTLLTDALLIGQNPRARLLLRHALEASGVDVDDRFRVAGVEPVDHGSILIAEDGRRARTDHLFWVTGVAAPDWLRQSGLTLDDDGFVLVDDRLRSVSHPGVFATGDVAALAGQPRPKAGVFAVREGPVLTTNLRRTVLGGRLERYRAQSRFLTLVGTADGSAVASRGGWAASGRWVWRWKDRIDRRFMSRFRNLPAMTEEPDVPAGLAGRVPVGMRCGGCGAKLGADPLRRVLARLPDQRALELRRGVLVGIGDDAAVVRAPADDLLLTVDGFRAVVDDAWLFGRITAHHSLNDVLAMGGQGLVALAMASVPLMADAMMEEELYQLLAGAVAVLNDHGVPLVGGHSAEGGELSLALSITGIASGARLDKGGLCVGDALVLTKPLGTGAVLAAHMRGRAGSDVVAGAISSMDHSNAPGLAILREHGVRALTDVSGFGLVGHLGEMLRAAGLGVTLSLDRVPLLSGAEALVAQGLVSSLQENNELALNDFEVPAAPRDGRDPARTSFASELRSPRLRLLVDPQTSGGLLAAVPAERVERCIAALRSGGYQDAASIGVVTASGWQVL